MNITEMTVAALTEAIEKRELSSREITEAFLARADETEPSVNSYITLCREKALEAADKADKNDVPAIKKIPFAVKDNVAYDGVRMTCASRMLESFVPTYTAEVVERMGGIVLGKTNLDEFAMGSSCEKSLFGATHNPISYEYSAGGSSGGSAASVKACSAPWSVGTDTGGSARQPSAFCGVVSIKPTYGLVSRYGVAELASSLDTVCPITKDVFDSALVLENMAGHDRRDMTSTEKESYAGEFTSAIKKEYGIRGLRIGLMDGFEKYCDEAVTKSTLRAARIAEELGASVERTEMPSGDETLGAYMVISQAECSSNLSRYDGIKYGYNAGGDDYREIMRRSRSEGFGDEVKRRIMSGCYALSESHGGNFFAGIKGIRSRICREAAALFEKYDVVMLPTAAGCAFRLGSFDTNPTMLYASDMFTVFANLTGVPAIQLPSGGNGTLPCGISLMAAANCDKLLFSVAHTLESEMKNYVASEVGNVR